MNTAEFLKQHVGIFADFCDERLRDLTAGSRVVSFEANEAVAHQGDEATHFGVVLSGTLNAAVLGDAATRHSLGQLKSGDTFGEMAMMTGDPLPADFIAESRCEVLLIPVGLFQSQSVVAHRVVHGGEKFTEGTLITDEVLAQIEALNPLAPLHNPLNVAGIREMRRTFPAVPHCSTRRSTTRCHHTPISTDYPMSYMNGTRCDVMVFMDPRINSSVCGPPSSSTAGRMNCVW
jgi:hypothetical protein